MIYFQRVINSSDICVSQTPKATLLADPQVLTDVPAAIVAVKQEDGSPTSLTTTPIDGASHGISDKGPVHDVFPGRCCLRPPVAYADHRTQNHLQWTLAPYYRSLIPHLRLTQPPLVLSPSPSPHRLPTDLLCICSVYFYLRSIIYLADNLDPYAVDNDSTGEQGKLLCRLSPS